MASRKSGSDFQNSGGTFSYLDDVPFRVGDKFKIPAKVGFPVGFCIPDYSVLLKETHYNFSLEKKTNKWAEEIKRIKAEQEAANLSKEASAMTAKGETLSENSSGIQYTDGPLSRAFPPPMNPILASLRHNNILTPMPANSNAVKQKDPSPPNATTFNLADFESEEDPFDKLELKTLNDKEELKNILEVQASSRQVINSQPDNGLEIQVVGLADTLPGPEVHVSTEEVTSDFKALHKPNGLINLPQLENCEKVPLSAKVSLPPSSAVSNIKSLSFPKLESDESDLKTAKLTGTFHSTSLPNGTLFSSVKNGDQYKVSGLNGHHSTVASMRSSSSFDLTTHPSSSRTNASPVLSRPGRESSSHKSATVVNSQSHPTPAESPTVCLGNTKTSPSRGEFPDFLKVLSPSQRHCAETIVSMGYSCENVIKAMQKRGENLEQVLDYLYVHGRLCERGYEPALVEEGLEVYRCSEPKALKFLQLMSKFREMGFEHGVIKEVLLFHKNDQEKALEDLMARAGAS
ncbi:ubiquitin-associated protein 1 [Callorhinchus milii]|nr:ubiquitin-associated protein 1 [Callorhinchus milii]